MKTKLYCNLDAYFSKGIKHVHISFDKALLSIDNRTKIVSGIYRQWDLICLMKRQHIKLFFLQLIHSVHWKFDYAIFKKKKQQQKQKTHVNNELLLAEIGNSLVISFMLFR